MQNFDIMQVEENFEFCMKYAAKLFKGQIKHIIIQKCVNN